MKRHIRHTFLQIAVFLLLPLFLCSCFNDPSVIAPPPVPIERAKPFVVSADSVTFNLFDNDDGSGDPRHNYVTSNTAPFLGLRDSSRFVLDTSFGVPTLLMNLNVSPYLEKQKDMIDLQNKMITIVTDTVSVSGEDWILLNNGQVVYTVRTVLDKGQLGKFEALKILQQRPGPYTKDESFARAFLWKVTAKKEIRINLDTQIWYPMRDDKGNLFRVRSRMGGTITIRY